MKGIRSSGLAKYTVAILFILLGNLQSLHAGDRQIVVVKSSNNAYFNQTIETLISNADDHAHFKIIDTNSLDSARDILQKADVVVTLGTDSASAVTSQAPNQLIMNAYITLEQAEQFQHLKQNHIAVLLNQPLERYLVFSQRLLNLKTLGTINRSNPVLISRQIKTSRKLNLKLDPYQLDESNKRLLATVRQLIKKNEALLMLPDQTIYNRDTLKGILLTAYRSRTPVISYSPGHVKSGALAAIYSSPANIGQHLANLINQHHRGKLNTNNKLIYAEYYSIATNQRVAHSLGLDLPSDEKLRQLIDESAK
jgi:putative ABC transport system substrate-binding protein